VTCLSIDSAQMPKRTAGSNAFAGAAVLPPPEARPDEWGPELPEDPIMSSQAPTADFHGADNLLSCGAASDCGTMSAMTSMIRLGGAKRAATVPNGPAHTTRWRNVGKRLGVLALPGDGEPLHHLDPGVLFEVLRVASVEGHRYLQLASGQGWVPECSRKDPSRIVAVLAPDDDSAALEHNDKKMKLDDSTHALIGLNDLRCEDAQRPEVNEVAQNVCQDVDQKVEDVNRFSPVRLRKLRIIVLATRSSNAVSTHISEIALRCKDNELKITSFTAENPNGQSPCTEGAEKILCQSGKWLDFNFRSHGQSTLLLTSPVEFSVTDLAFRTASDSAARDPVQVRVDGSVADNEWITLHETGKGFPTPTMRRAWSPWLLLQPQGSPSNTCMDPSVSSGVTRFRCCVPRCHVFDACVEGYLWEGNLLSHMLREHPRARGTKELEERLKSAKTKGCQANSLGSPQKVSPQKVSPQKVSPQKVSPQKVSYADTVTLAELLTTASREAEESKRKKSTNDVKVPDTSARPVASPARVSASAATATGFLKLRITVLATRSLSVASTHVGELRLKYKDQPVDLFGISVTNPQGNNPTSEGPEKIISSNGKWLDLNFRSHGQSVLIFEGYSSIDATDIAFCTARDLPGRDPVRVRVESYGASEDWVLLNNPSEELPMPVERRSWSPWLPLKPQNNTCDVRSMLVNMHAHPAEHNITADSSASSGTPASNAVHTVCAKQSIKTVRSTAEVYNHMQSPIRCQDQHQSEISKDRANQLATSEGSTICHQVSPSTAGTPPAINAASNESSDPPVTPDWRASRSSLHRAKQEDDSDMKTPSPLPLPAGLQDKVYKFFVTTCSGSGGLSAVEAASSLDAELCHVLSGIRSLTDASLLVQLADGKFMPVRACTKQKTVEQEVLKKRGSQKDIVWISELSLTSHSVGPIVATVVKRVEHFDGHHGFHVQLKDASGEVEARFAGVAAGLYHDSLALREGCCIRLQGFHLVSTTQAPSGALGKFCLQFEQVSDKVQVVAMDALQQVKTTPLKTLQAQASKGKVDVEAVVGRVCDLQHQELRLQPGEFVTTRTVVLEHDSTFCDWVLWANDAERYGPGLAGRRVIVRGARAHVFNGQLQITGCSCVHVCD